LKLNEYFLKGCQHLHQLDLDESKKMFEKAVGLDSRYAPAYAGLAAVHSWLYESVGSNNSDLEAADMFFLLVKIMTKLNKNLRKQYN
jgi:Tfp pilus assembly protein PilF